MEPHVILRQEQELLVYKTWEAETKYRVFQIYGQLYVKDLEAEEEPEGWTEVYATEMPRDASVDAMFLFFARGGAIFQMRVLMDFSGYNRGQLFVRYHTAEAARRAICCLDGELLQDRHVKVRLSLDNNQLVVRSLPPHLSDAEVRAALEAAMGEGLAEMRLRSSKMSSHCLTCSRRWCFCTYQDHRFAVMAHKKVWPYVEVSGCAADVHWAVPELIRCGTSLYFTSFPDDLTKEEFYSILLERLDIKSIVQFRFTNINYGYITFFNKNWMMTGERLLRGLTIRGHEMIFSTLPFENTSFNMRRTNYYGNYNYYQTVRPSMNPVIHDYVPPQLHYNNPYGVRPPQPQYYNANSQNNFPRPPFPCFYSQHVNTSVRHTFYHNIGNMSYSVAPIRIPQQQHSPPRMMGTYKPTWTNQSIPSACSYSYNHVIYERSSVETYSVVQNVPIDLTTANINKESKDV